MKHLNIAAREKLDGYLFISPWVIGFLLFYSVPMVFSFIISFCNWDYLKDLTFIGLKNYFRIFSKDGYALAGLQKTAIFVGLEVPLQLSLSLAIAYLLTQGIRGTKITRAIDCTTKATPTITTISGAPASRSRFWYSLA